MVHFTVREALSVYQQPKINYQLVLDKTLQQLTEQQLQPVESMNPLAWSNELYKTGMALDRRKHQTAIRGTLRLLESALQKMEHAVSLYEEEAAKRGFTYENPADIRERYNKTGQ